MPLFYLDGTWTDADIYIYLENSATQWCILIQNTGTTADRPSQPVKSVQCQMEMGVQNENNNVFIVIMPRQLSFHASSNRSERLLNVQPGLNCFTVTHHHSVPQTDIFVWRSYYSFRLLQVRRKHIKESRIRFTVLGSTMACVVLLELRFNLVRYWVYEATCTWTFYWGTNWFI